MNESRTSVRAPLVAAYYYPGWARDPLRVVRGCAGASEWDLLYDEVAFHAYPEVRRPITGPVEPDVASVEKEAAAAHASGIDAFLWCWYWDRGRLMMNETLEMFLQSRLPAGFGYALMWVNKRAHAVLPLREPLSNASERARVIATDEDDFRSMVQHLMRHHWSRPQYLTFQGRPMLLLYRYEFLVRDLGAERLRRLLSLGQSLARSAGFPGICYVAILHTPSPSEPSLHNLLASAPEDVVSLREIGFQALSTYVYLPDWAGPSTQQYSSLIDKRALEWSALARTHALPLWPSISPGWDARPRADPCESDKPRYPWQPQVIGETPRDFSRLLKRWLTYAEQCGNIPLLPIASWNEWSEGHAIAPCDRHGDGLLRTLAEFKASLPNRHMQASAIVGPEKAPEE